MSVNDGIGAVSFDGVEFPYTSRTWRIATRTHEHEFPRMPGAKIEKMGRKVFVFSFDVPFHATTEKYPDLYPGSLNLLTTKCIEQSTGPLYIPEIGRISALLTEIERKRKGATVSGEDATLHFVEDDEAPFALVALPVNRATFESAAADVQSQYAELPASGKAQIEKESKPRTSLFGALGALTDAIASIKDQATLYGNTLAGKLDKVSSLCHTLHETIAFVRRPENDALARSLRNLDNATKLLASDLHQKGQTQRTYVVPARMTLSDVSAATYGDSTHGGELLSLNRASIKDPYAIAAGTRIQYYAAA